MAEIKICVLGGGVIGVSTAVNIIENVCNIKNIQVDILSEEFSPNTTSDIAGGYWEPHDITDISQTDILRFSEITFHHMQKLSVSEDAGKVGAFMLPGYSISKHRFEPPIYKDIYHGFREMTKAELTRFEGASFGFTFTSVVVECSKYLPWLTKRFVERGGRVFKRKIHALSDLAAVYDIVVNCTGMGARDLVNDDKVTAARGQMIKVDAPWIKHFAEDHDTFAYIIPRTDHVLLGGTYDEGKYDTTVNLKTRENILADCVKLAPSLKFARHIGDLVGLRPCRSPLRLEAEEIPTHCKKLQVVHNYGHSGSGVTLHWGCAQEAAGLVMEAVNRIQTTQAKI